MYIIATIAIVGFLLLLLETVFFVVLGVLLPWIVVAVTIVIGIRIGRKLDAKYNRKRIFFIIPTAFVMVPSLWVFASYKEFDSLCKSAPSKTINSRSQSPQSGFLLDDLALHEFHSRKYIGTPDRLLREKQIIYYDEIFKEASNDFRPKVYRRSRVSNSNIAEPISEFAFKVSPVERIHSLWKGPIYRITYSVESIHEKTVLARGSEYIYGGGIVGLYVHAMLGEFRDHSDREFSYVSCGYASSAPDAWRPKNKVISDPNSERYFKADKELLSTIIF